MIGYGPVITFCEARSLAIPWRRSQTSPAPGHGPHFRPRTGHFPWDWSRGADAVDHLPFDGPKDFVWLARAYFEYGATSSHRPVARTIVVGDPHQESVRAIRS